MVSHIFPCPCCIYAECFVSLQYYGLFCCILFTHIPVLRLCMIFAKYRILSEGCRLCSAAMVVQDGQGLVATLVMHPCQMLWKLVVIWIGLQSPSVIVEGFPQESRLLQGGSIVCSPPMVVVDGQSHAPISMLHP